MKALKIILLVLMSFILIGCATLKTSSFQTYEWDATQEDYVTDGNTYEKDLKFKITDKEITFKVEKKYTLTILSEFETKDENGQVFVYDCIMDGAPFRAVHYIEKDAIIIYENLGDGRFNTFVLFGN